MARSIKKGPFVDYHLMQKVEKARGHNKAAVALANKMARLVWAVWRNDRDYQPVPVAA